MSGLIRIRRAPSSRWGSYRSFVSFCVLITSLITSKDAFVVATWSQEEGESAIVRDGDVNGDGDGGGGGLFLRGKRSLKKRGMPVMHTFYNRIDPEVFHKDTGMSDEDDAALLETWRSSWEAAGWETRILTLEDARPHPEFDKFDALLDLEDMPFGYYDKLCYLRWLAMAAVGGGWMSDYDTFPLRSINAGHDADLPHGGRLTIYDKVRAGAVPSVVSGSSAEYDRIAHRLLYDTLRRVGTGDNDHWSDMFALMDLYQNGRHGHDEYVVMDQVVKGDVALASHGHLQTFQDCHALVGKYWAVHFSHMSVTEGVRRGYLAEGEKAKDRPHIAARWLDEWRTSCAQVHAEVFDPEEGIVEEEGAVGR